jgi:uncharacterized coiled-coil protein SlyX
MKKLFKRLKHSSLSLFYKLRENAISVYIILGLCCLFFINNTVKDTKHFNEKAKLVKENIELAESFNYQMELINDLQKTNALQQDTMGNMRMYIMKLESVIQMQNDVLQKLIDKLKELDMWPPKQEEKGRSWATQSNEKTNKTGSKL